jgi:hypothetical protein
MNPLGRLVLVMAAAIACGKSAPVPVPLLVSKDGQVMKHPHLVTITWANYEFRDQVEAFGEFVVGSDWLKTVVGEYGVGAGTHTVVRLPDRSPDTLFDGDLSLQLLRMTQAGQLPAPDGQTLYMVYIPATTAFSNGFGTKACITEGAYHSPGFSANSYNAVIYDCSGTVDDVTALASHELIESAVDPTLTSFVVQYPHLPLFLENADLCENFATVDAGGFQVTRGWSNAAARDGANPCVPAGQETYYTVSVSPSGVAAVTPGQTLTYDLTGWSDGNVDPWVLTPLPGRLSDPGLGVSVDKTRIGNGEHATLKLTIPADARPGQAFYVNLYSGPDLERDAIVGAYVPGLQD